MKRQDRWASIIEMCKYQDEVKSADISKELKISLATVRRDLQMMEELGMIIRTHGGCHINSAQTSEPPMLMKNSQNPKGKYMVGRYAATLIKDNMMVYIDAGSATYSMLSYITAKNITVVTIGIPHISRLIEKNIRTIVLGGTVRPSTQAITGMVTMEQIKNFYFDIAFIGVNGIHPIYGLSTTNEFEAVVKKEVIAHSASSYALADSTKFNVIIPSSFATINGIKIITDSIGDYEGDTGSIIQVKPLFDKQQ
mgnify:FL=1